MIVYLPLLKFLTLLLVNSKSLSYRLTKHRFRPGFTIAEMVLFIGLTGMMAGTLLPFIINSSRARQRQDAIALVEQSGVQVMQSITEEIREAEGVLDPPKGGTGFILALKTADPETNPTIIALHSGAIILVEGRTRRTLTPSLVGVTHFLVDNTSSTATRENVTIALGLERTIRILQPTSYTSFFEKVINLSPDDVEAETECDCVTPFCDNDTKIYTWQVCRNNLCIPYADFDCDTTF